MNEQDTVRVLLVDDDEDDYVLTRDLFADIAEGRYQLDWVDTFEQGFTAICRGGHDVYLVDYKLGAHTGLELLREALAAGCTTPIILLTGQSDREIDIEAMRLGAADYLIKMQTDAPLLERSIRYALERKKIEEGIIAAEKRFRAVFEQSADAVLLVELDSRRIIDANVAFRRMIDASQEELLCLTLYDIVAANHSQVDDYIQTAVNRSYLFVDEWSFATRHHTAVAVEASLHSISYGQTRALSIMARALPPHKIQPTAQQSNNTLTADLLNGLLRELRTSLTSMLGTAGLLERELAALHSTANTRALSSTISSLLSILSHVSTIMRCGHPANEAITPFSVVHALREIAAPFEQAALAKNVGLQINLRNDALVKADRALFARAIGALIDNAVRFTHRGVVSLTVDTQTTHGSYSVLLQITDTGIGIAPDVLPRVFEPFERHVHERNAQQKGHGLGLAIARSVLQSIGGSIRLISTEGEGTTALCSIPALPLQDHLPAEGIPSVETNERFLGLPQMLVIEDDRGYQKLIARHFDGIYRTDCAETAEQAVSLCQNSMYSLILVDINLGYGRSGIDALMQIRRLPNYHDIPAIAVTAYSFELKRKELFEAGFSDYIQKPFTQSQILSVVSHHIAMSKRVEPLSLS